MINLRNSPFLWFALLLLLSYSSGGEMVLLQSPNQTLWLTILCGAAACHGLLKYHPGRQIWSTLALAVLFYGAGLIRIVQFEADTMPGDPLPRPVKTTGFLEVTEVLKEKTNSLSVRCRKIHFASKDTLMDTYFHDKFLVLQIRENELKKILPGDILWTSGWIAAIPGPMNPHAFDIRTYYKSIGIRHQMTCKGTDVRLDTSSRSSLMRLTATWQSGLCNIIRNHTSSQVAQLTNALVWGDRTSMDADIREAFADSGAMHVLSVSGMHMAIIYSMLYLLLGAPGSGTYIRRIFRFGLYTLAIVLYMGLTGACPAVVRSGLMIILFLLGKSMGWNTQIWNLLGFAAFLMLWINPFVMYNIGFQLSFLAMAGILLYAQPMIRFLSFKNIILQRTWEVTAVSMAAQVFIFPLLLFHFHQFPLTFVASSLIAMPASYVIIFGALLNTCLAFLHWTWLWDIFDTFCLYFMLSMKWLAGLNPDMNYSLPELAGLLLTSMAILFSVALVYRWPPGKKLAYLLGMVAFVNLALHRANQWNKDEVVFYHQYKGLMLDIVIGGHCLVVHDSLVNHQSMEYAARGHRCYKDVISIQAIPKSVGVATAAVHYQPPVLEASGKRILIWNGEVPEEENFLTITHLVLDQAKDFERIKNIAESVPALVVILPAHLNRYAKSVLAEFLEAHKIRYHDISVQGYYSLPL